jgi:hypothetical protein
MGSLFRFHNTQKTLKVLSTLCPCLGGVAALKMPLYHARRSEHLATGFQKRKCRAQLAFGPGIVGGGFAGLSASVEREAGLGR